MWFKHRAWIPIAWVLSVANLAAVWVAAAPAEPWHATVHGLLAVACALGARHLSARRRTVAQDERLHHVMEGLQARLWELEERLDFTERMLAQHRDADRVGMPPR